MEYSGRWKKILELAAQKNLPKYRLEQLSRALYNGKTKDFLHMVELPKQFRMDLSHMFDNKLLSLTPVTESIGGHAHKVLFSTNDGINIEAVSLDFKTHRSLCISSQAGCAFNCSFCATGKLGLKRQLTVDEITDQVLYFMQQGHEIDSISFMGMGEPLSNPRVFESLHLLQDSRSYGLSARRLNISTIGILPGIKKLNQNHPKVNLTFSLHNAFPQERTAIMPSNALYPIDEVMKLLEERITTTGRRIWLAYLLLKDINDSKDHAMELVNLIKKQNPYTKHLYHVNLLPYNKAFSVSEEFNRLENDNVAQFEDILRKNHISVSYRNSFGHEIEAACGQLHANYVERLNQGPRLGERKKDDGVELKV